MSIQNPTIPTATQAKGIDAHVNDLQTSLSFDLSWLTDGMGRAYKKKKNRSNGVIDLLPLVYLGTANTNYFTATPDNTKQGQSIIIIGDGTMINQRAGFYALMEYDISIIFSANLKLVDATLLLTEDFTEHLMEDVREAIVRNLLGKSYRLEITNETRDFEDVYSEFDVAVGTTNEPLLPMTYFRFDCTMSFQEDCTGVTLNRCAAILQNLTEEDLCTCIIPTLDFNGASSQYACLSNQQKLDLYNTIPPPCYTFFDGLNDYVNIPTSASLDFTKSDAFSYSFWINDSNPGNTGFVLRKRGNPSLAGLQINTGGATVYKMSLFGSATGNIDIVSNVYATGWNHVLFTYDGSELNTGLNVYVNGVLDNDVRSGTFTASDIVTTDPLYIGGGNTGLQFNGYLDEIIIFNTEKTAGEAALLYAEGRQFPDYSAVTGILSRYTMAALNPVDQVGSNNGTSVNQSTSTNIICG